jgi:hypothetical protein
MDSKGNNNNGEMGVVAATEPNPAYLKSTQYNYRIFTESLKKRSFHSPNQQILKHPQSKETFTKKLKVRRMFG